MDYALSPQQQQFRNEFDAFCVQHIAPLAAEDKPEGYEIAYQRLADHGFLRLFHGEDSGGTAADPTVLASAMEILAGHWTGLAWSLVLSAALCGKMLAAHDTPTTRTKYFRPLLSGEKVGAFAYAENVGSDAVAYRTTLRKCGDGYRISGHKSRIGNIMRADFTLVYCNVEDGGRHGTGFVVVDLRQPGVVRTAIEGLGLHGLQWGEVEFCDVPVPEDNVIATSLGGTYLTLDEALAPVQWGQIMQACCAVGVAARALREATHFLRDREVFGRSLLHLPAVLTQLGQMRAELEAGRLLALQAIWHKASGVDAKVPILQAKVHCTEMVARMSSTALQLFGAWGYSTRMPIERIFRDSLGGIASGVQNDYLRDMWMCAQLGLSPHEHGALDWLGPAGLA